MGIIITPKYGRARGGLSSANRIALIGPLAR